MKFCLFLVLLVSIVVSKSNLRTYTEDPVFISRKHVEVQPVQPRFEEV